MTNSRWLVTTGSPSKQTWTTAILRSRMAVTLWSLRVTLVSFSMQSWQCLLNALCWSGFFQLRQLRPFVRSQNTRSGVHIMPSGLLQLASVWSDWPITSRGESSRCRMPQHASSPEPDVVTTLCRWYVSCTGFQFGAERSSNSPVWYVRHCVAYVSGRWHPPRLWRQPTVSPVFLWQHVCGATYAQQLRRQKFRRCRSANLEQSAKWPPNTWHQLQTF